jgi:hypothetical protein
MISLLHIRRGVARIASVRPEVTKEYILSVQSSEKQCLSQARNFHAFKVAAE